MCVYIYIYSSNVKHLLVPAGQIDWICSFSLSYSIINGESLDDGLLVGRIAF